METVILWIGENKWCIPVSYVAVVSLLAVILTVYDKIAAVKRPEHRIRENTLFALSALGGSAVMLLTMLAIRHKTLHKRFMIGIPVIMVIQLLAVVALIFFGVISY